MDAISTASLILKYTETNLKNPAFIKKMPKIAYKRTLNLETAECSAIFILGITAFAKTGATGLERPIFGKTFTAGIPPFFIGAIETV